MTPSQYLANITARFGPQTRASLAARENAAMRKATGQQAHNIANASIPGNAADPAHVEKRRAVWASRAATRRGEILAMLAEGGTTSADIAQRLRISHDTASDYLQQLKAEGLTEFRRAGRLRIWRAA